MNRTIALVVGFVCCMSVGPLLAAPDTWDSRLTDLGVYYTEANVSPGTWYWRLTIGLYENENESGGNHNIYYKTLDANGNPIENQKIWAAWPTGNPTNTVYQFTKGAFDGYWGNFAMSGGWCPFWPEGPRGPYGAYVDGPSDQVWGMGMPCNLHVNYLMTWRWTQKSGGGGSPTITRSPATLSPSCTAGGNASNQTFTVQNTGAGTLSYSISDDQTWLSCSPASGTSTGEADTITVSYSTSGLAAGTYSATITISDANATNNPQTIAVSLTVNPAEAPATENFAVMPAWSSSFDAAWGGAAAWSIVSGGQSGNCLQAQRSNTGSSSKVKVYSISANTTYSISVYIRCPSSSSYWAETAFKFGNYTAQDFDANAGTWTLIQKFASDGVNGNGDVWTQYSATFSSASNTQVSVGYKLGSSSGNGPIVRWDTLNITAQGASPAIGRSPATLSPSCTQGGNPANQTFTVQNTGGGTLSYSISDNVTWLSCSPASGTSTGEADTITVTYAASGLTAGTYNGTITISDPNATNNPQTIAVTLTVNAPPPTIGRSPATLSPSCTQGGNPANQTFTVQNTGGGTLSYSISDNVTWLSCSPASGTSTGEADTITVTYAASGLTAGTYNGTITISDPNATNNPQTIAVTLTVTAPGKLTVSEDFDAVPSWSSSFDAAWGGAATWSSVTGGQAGNCLQATRSNTGSSAKVNVYNITANQSYTIRIYARCPSSAESYWREMAFRLGNYSAQDFDANSGSWTMVKKFANTGTNGNGDTWVEYTATFNSGSSTQISVGFKTGNSTGTAPTIKWDTLRIN